MTATIDAEAIRAVVDGYETSVKRCDVQAYVSLFDDDVIGARPALVRAGHAYQQKTECHRQQPPLAV